MKHSMKFVALHLAQNMGCWVAVGLFCDAYGPRITTRHGDDDILTGVEASRVLTQAVEDMKMLDVPVPEDAVERAIGAGLVTT